MKFSYREEYWEGPRLASKLSDGDIGKRFSEGWSDATVKTMPRGARWPVYLRWNPDREVFEGEDHCHNVEYYVLQEVMDKKLRKGY